MKNSQLKTQWPWNFILCLHNYVPKYIQVHRLAARTQIASSYAESQLWQRVYQWYGHSGFWSRDRFWWHVNRNWMVWVRTVWLWWSLYWQCGHLWWWSLQVSQVFSDALCVVGVLKVLWLWRQQKISQVV